ncbi:amiloride-sensitive sodium channel subunit gamma [Brachionus plicatilis]|uniref:Amiloride-sensitive sodium channel subunit gamma n=1 Tax=Brachionus plicatilis TaxID=10195 RepID=A0A3M7QVC4_BRAPC|nr:amiloride-sensitive sodium channel subunit gamma [Brachionus plicatilis]
MPLTGDLLAMAKSESKQPKFKNLTNKFGDSLEKLFIDCRFEGLKCNLTEFKYFFHPHYGNCYQFNTGFNYFGEIADLKRTMWSDRLLGLRLILNISLSESLKFMNPNTGALISVHNQTAYPLDELTVGPKTETNIALSRTFYESQPKPYSKCDGKTNDVNSYDSEYYKIVHKNTKGYSQTLCVYQCIQKFFIDGCSCSLDSLPSFYDSYLCTQTKENNDCL